MMSKYLNLYDVCADHPEAGKERQELCNDVITLRARVAELEKECEYDQRNAAMSQAESVKAYERIEELERLLKCSADLENEAHHQLIVERAKVERLREALTNIRDYGLDRDGETTSEKLGELVDELVQLASEALVTTAPKE